jgi:hypothetical protein
LCDPWLATGDFRDASAACRIAYDDKRNLLAVDGCGCTMRGLNDGIENLFRNIVTLITAAAVMGLQQTHGFIHEASLMLQPLARPQDRPTHLLERAIDSSDAARAV